MTTTGYINLQLANMAFDAKLDSGAEHILISQAVFDKLPTRFQNRLKESLLQ